MTKQIKILAVLSLALTLHIAGYAQSGIQFPKHDTTSVNKYYPYVLPIWGQKVVDRNIEL